jgi:hypothetical protein
MQDVFNINWRPRRALGSRVHYAYIVEILCPKINKIRVLPKKLSAFQQKEIIQRLGNKSLRELAGEYNVSYETVRRTRKRNEDLPTPLTCPHDTTC